MPDSFAVILNAGSGNKQTEEKLRQLREAFSPYRLNPKIFLAHGGQALASAVQKALAEGYKMLAAAGGDGTVNAVAAEVLRAGAVLGILPMGTLNHLAKDLKISLDLKHAIETLLFGRIATIDAAQVNGKIFMNNSGIGLYPKLALLRERHQNLGKDKWLAFLLALGGIFWRYSFYNVRVEIKGKDIALKSPFIFVGNNKYEVEGLNLGVRQNINGGELSVLVLRHSTKWGLVILAGHALFGGLASHPDFDVYSTNRARVDTTKKFLAVALDGEVITLPAPLEYSILPAALKVLVPKI